MFKIRIIFILCPVLITANAQQHSIEYDGTSNVRVQRPQPGPIYRPRPQPPPRSNIAATARWRTSPAAYTQPSTVTSAPKPLEVFGPQYQGTVYDGIRRPAFHVPAPLPESSASVAPWTPPYGPGFSSTPVSYSSSTPKYLTPSPLTIAKTPAEINTVVDAEPGKTDETVAESKAFRLSSPQQHHPSAIVPTDEPLTNSPIVSHFVEPPSTEHSPPQTLTETKTNLTCRDGGFHPVPNECDSFIDCRYFIAMKYYCQDGLHFNPALKNSVYPCSDPTEVQCEPGATAMSEQQYPGYNPAPYRYQPRPPPLPRRQIRPSTPVRSSQAAITSAPADSQVGELHYQGTVYNGTSQRVSHIPAPLPETSTAPQVFHVPPPRPTSSPRAAWQGGLQYQGTVYNGTSQRLSHIPAPLPESSTYKAQQVFHVPPPQPTSSPPAAWQVGEHQYQGTVYNGTSQHIPAPLPEASTYEAPQASYIPPPRPTSSPPAAWQGGQRYQGTVYNSTGRQGFHEPAPRPTSSASVAPWTPPYRPGARPSWSPRRPVSSTPGSDTSPHLPPVTHATPPAIEVSPEPEVSPTRATTARPMTNPPIPSENWSTTEKSSSPETIIVGGHQYQGTVYNGTSQHIPAPLPESSTFNAPQVSHASPPRPTSSPPAAWQGGQRYQGTVYNSTGRQGFHNPASWPTSSAFVAPWTPPYRPGARPSWSPRRPVSSTPGSYTSPRLPPVTHATPPAIVVSPEPEISHSPEPVPAFVDVNSVIYAAPLKVDNFDDLINDVTDPSVTEYKTVEPVTEYVTVEPVTEYVTVEPVTEYETVEPVTVEPVTLGVDYWNVQPSHHINLPPAPPRPNYNWRPAITRPPASTPAPVTTRRVYYRPISNPQIPLGRVPPTRATTARPMTNPPIPSENWSTTEKSSSPETIIVGGHQFQGTVYNGSSHVPAPVPDHAASEVSWTPKYTPVARPILPPRRPVYSTPKPLFTMHLPPVTASPQPTIIVSPEPQTTPAPKINSAFVEVFTVLKVAPEVIETETLKPSPVPSGPKLVNIQPSRHVNLPPTSPRPKFTQRPPVFGGRFPLTSVTTPAPMTTTRRVYYPPTSKPVPPTVRVPQTRATTPRPLTNPPTPPQHIKWPTTANPPTDIYIDPLAIDYTCNGNGYYVVPNECDTYIICDHNEAYKHWCPDGLHFNPDAKFSDYPCAYPSEVKCSPGAKLQPSRSTEYCPQQFGYFALDHGDCSQYISCEHGVATVMDCPAGLVFNETISTCDWPINVQPCNSHVFKDFVCPAPPIDQGVESDIILKYRYGQDCSLYIACQLGHPRLLSCDSGTYFDVESQTCIDDYLVTDCMLATPY